MNYIKSYDIFESINDPDSLESCLKEIISEYKLYNVRFNFGDTRKSSLFVKSQFKYIYIFTKMSSYDGFWIKDVSDVVLRLIDFLDDRYKGVSAVILGESDRTDFKLLDPTYNSSLKIRQDSINYWNDNLGPISNLIIMYND